MTRPQIPRATKPESAFVLEIYAHEQLGIPYEHLTWLPHKRKGCFIVRDNRNDRSVYEVVEGADVLAWWNQ